MALNYFELYEICQINPLLFTSRAYFQQSPTCTRVQIIQLAFLLIITSYPLYMLLIMPARERGCVHGSDPYVICKSLMSPNLTLPHHHMMPVEV